MPFSTFGLIEGIAPTRDPYFDIGSCPLGFGERYVSTVGEMLSNSGLFVPEDEEDVFGASGQRHVRRPLRGIQIKDPDGTYATMSVRSLNVPDLRVLLTNESYQAGTDVAKPQHSRTSNFMLQAVNETRQEKHQIVQTFDNAYIFFYGEQPRVLSFGGILLNTEDFAWRYEWWRNYEDFFRGTRLVQQGLILEIAWDDIEVEGYVLNASCAEQSEAPYHIQLQFQLFVTAYRSLHNPSANFPLSGQTEIDPIQIDKPEYTSTAAKVRSLSLSNYLRENITYSRAVSFIRSRDNFGSRSLVAGVVTASAYETLKRFIFGRPLRVPAGFAGSEAAAGLEQASFAQGTGFNQITLQALFGRSLPYLRQQYASGDFANIRTVNKAESWRESPLRGRFRDNFDEFPKSGLVYHAGNVYAQEDARLAAQLILQEAAEQRLTLLVAQEEAWYFENVARETLQEFGVNPDASVGFWQGLAMTAVGAAILFTGSTVLAPDVPNFRAQAQSRVKASDAEVSRSLKYPGAESARGRRVPWGGF